MKPLAPVTGGQQGIGLGIATALADAGFRIALSSRSGADSPQVQAALERLGPTARYFQHDLADVQAAPRRD